MYIPALMQQNHRVVTQLVADNAGPAQKPHHLVRAKISPGPGRQRLRPLNSIRIRYTKLKAHFLNSSPIGFRWRLFKPGSATGPPTVTPAAARPAPALM